MQQPTPPQYEYVQQDGKMDPFQRRSTNVVYQVSPAIGPSPSLLECPICHEQVISDAKPVAGLLTYLLSGGICLLGGIFCCCLIPCCCRRCQDIEHKCPKCKYHLATYKRV